VKVGRGAEKEKGKGTTPVKVGQGVKEEERQEHCAASECKGRGGRGWGRFPHQHQVPQPDHNQLWCTF